VEASRKLGRKIIKGRDGFYYSVPSTGQDLMKLDDIEFAEHFKTAEQVADAILDGSITKAAGERLLMEKFGLKR